MNILLMSVLFFCIKSASKVNCYKDVICCYCFLLTMQWACQSLTLRLLGLSEPDPQIAGYLGRQDDHKFQTSFKVTAHLLTTGTL